MKTRFIERRWLSAFFGTAMVVASAGLPSVVPAAEPAADELSAGDIDPGRSRIYVHVGKRRLGHEHGVEGKVKSGHLVLDASEDAGEIVFDMKSFKADTDAARKYVGLEGTSDADEQKDVTATMTGKGVLNVAGHPTATFAVESSERMRDDVKDGKQRYELVGEFLLRGKKQPLKIVAVADELKNGQLQLTGNFTIKQTDYGIKPYSTFGGIVAVKDELKIYGDLWVQQ